MVAPPLPQAADHREGPNVVITGIQIPFWSLVSFMVQCSVAIIPAALALFILGGFLTFLLSAMGIGFLGGGK